MMGMAGLWLFSYFYGFVEGYDCVLVGNEILFLLYCLYYFIVLKVKIVLL